MALIASLIFLSFGLVVGSFINAAVYRVKTGRDWVAGRSICPKCKHKLAFWDLIPVFSYIFLMAKCRYCRKPISIQYPLVELAVAGLYLLIYFQEFRYFTHLPQAGLQLLLYPLLVFIFVYDLKYGLIADGSIWLFYALGLISFLVGRHMDFLPYLITPILLFVFFYGLYFFSKGAWIGGGDVKLVPAFGLFSGYLGLQAVMLGFVSGAVFSIFLLALKRKTLKSAIPFGPFLIFGFFLTYILGDKIWVWATLGIASVLGYNY